MAASQSLAQLRRELAFRTSAPVSDIDLDDFTYAASVYLRQRLEAMEREGEPSLDDYKALKFATRARRVARREAVKERSFPALTTTPLLAPLVTAGVLHAVREPVPARVLLSVPRVPLAYPLARGAAPPKGAESAEFVLDLADALLLVDDWEDARVVVLDADAMMSLRTDSRYRLSIAAATAAAAAAPPSRDVEGGGAGVGAGVGSGCADLRPLRIPQHTDSDDEVILVRSPRGLRRSRTSALSSALTSSPVRRLAVPALPAPRFQVLSSSTSGDYDKAATTSFRTIYKSGAGASGTWLRRPSGPPDSYARYAHMLPPNIPTPLLRYISEKHYEDGYAVEDAWLAGIAAGTPLAREIVLDDVPARGSVESSASSGFGGGHGAGAGAGAGAGTGGGVGHGGGGSSGGGSGGGGAIGSSGLRAKPSSRPSAAPVDPATMHFSFKKKALQPVLDSRGNWTLPPRIPHRAGAAAAARAALAAAIARQNQSRKGSGASHGPSAGSGVGGGNNGNSNASSSAVGRAGGGGGGGKAAALGGASSSSRTGGAGVGDSRVAASRSTKSRRDDDDDSEDERGIALRREEAARLRAARVAGRETAGPPPSPPPLPTLRLSAAAAQKRKRDDDEGPLSAAASASDGVASGSGGGGFLQTLRSLVPRLIGGGSWRGDTAEPGVRAGKRARMDPAPSPPSLTTLRKPRI